MPVLNLTEHEEQDFDAIPAGPYDAEVVEVEMQETKGGEDAKLPKGTPMFNIQFKVVNHEEHDNRRVWGMWIVPPKKVNGKNYEHYKMMNGQLVRLFKALGYDEATITSGDWEPDLDDMAGKECRIKVSRYPYDGEMRNKVTGIKPAGSNGEEESKLL